MLFISIYVVILLNFVFRMWKHLTSIPDIVFPVQLEKYMFPLKQKILLRPKNYHPGKIWRFKTIKLYSLNILLFYIFLITPNQHLFLPVILFEKIPYNNFLGANTFWTVFFYVLLICLVIPIREIQHCVIFAKRFI